MSFALNQKTTSQINDADVFWRAMESRDRRYDGQFVFGVVSTGIFCRPSCAARRPRRENVVFFSLPEAAEHAGFRACLRCRPKESGAADPQIILVQRACHLIQQEEKTGLDSLAAELQLSPFHLQRTFKNVMGITPQQYAEACRVQRFRDGVHQGDSITTAMYDAGYRSSSRLYERAQGELGMTPATYGKGGRGAQINYTVVETYLGSLLVAKTEAGICAVTLGDREEALEGNLRREFPAARIVRDDNLLRAYVRQVVASLEGKQPNVALPLDLQSTAFQRQVWRQLQSIPPGETRSYADVARSLGKPSAVRAVARACATNPAALVIPCHRVIREDKSLGGYRWGIERKQELLKREHQHKQKERITE